MSLPTQLQEYIHKSRYARWLTTENRREHWEETVQRYVDYFDNKFPHFPKEEIKNAILSLKTMPSMRALMTAGPALERDPIAGFNPVAGDTLVVTKEFGNVPIKTLAGKSATVLNKNGDWTPATFKSYGHQPVTKVTLRLNSNTMKEVFATANHRWVLSDGTVVPTSSLEKGNHINFVTAPKAEEDADYVLGIRHGLVYGDGAMTKTHKRVKGYHLRLCGTAKQDFLKYFTEYPISYPPTAEGDPIVMMYDTFAATHALKELPSAQETDSYLLGFIRGWFGADGHVGKKNPQVSICCNAAGRDWLLQYSERAGFVIQSISTQPRTTNYGERTEDSFVLRISRSSFTEADVLSSEKRALVKPLYSYYSVYSVEETEKVEEVFCAEVPNTNTFVLAGGLVTGNCSFVAIDDPRAFDEILYILMCGTGVGFSVERQYIAQLPIVGIDIGFTNGKPVIQTKDKLQPIDVTIIVEDSKQGWASAYRDLLKHLYAGEIPKWDVSLVRPAGAKLVTFGGRASGPDPLVDLFKFTIETFKQACGRKLTSIECHDLVCKIADTVVVGGVRRSALISLSNLSDDRMRLAKSGQWWINDPQRALANNSATYTERPQTEIFLKEWMSLIESKSGERGIFNKHAAIKKAQETGRRDHTKIHGTNPCFAADTLIYTTKGNIPIVDLVGKSATIWDGSQYVVIDNFRVTGENQEVFKITLNDGSIIKATAYHTFYLEDNQRVELSQLTLGMSLLSSCDNLFGFDKKPGWNRITKIESDGIHEKVYCCTVPNTHKVTLANGITTGQCAEISLRSAGLCNLSEVVIRSTDTLEDLKYKVRIAAIIGTYQSLLTDFKYIRPIWKQNQEDERLLGVSLTGIMDHPILCKTNGEATWWLQEMKKHAIEVNAQYAYKLGIKPAAAITTVKPSGTVSQLVDSASGIHPRYSKHYIRTVRADKKDPLAQLMVSQGFPVEDAFGKEDSTYVFSFPVKGPSSGVYRDDRTAIQQLEHYLMYQKHWSEHNVSNTIYVKEDEWLEVGAWVFNNFDDLAGVSFLPHSNHSYKQAPYQECTEAEYEALLAVMPSFDWDALSEFEKDDATVNTKEYACTSGVCEII